MNTKEMTKESALRLKKALESVGNLQWCVNCVNSCDEWYIDVLPECNNNRVIICQTWEENSFCPQDFIIDNTKVVEFILKGRKIKTSGLKTPYQRRLLWKAINTVLGVEKSTVNKVDEDYREEYDEYEMEEN